MIPDYVRRVQLERHMEKMMKKKMKTKKKPTAAKTKAVKVASRKGKRGGSVAGLGPRKCGVCGKRGHNRRSHEPKRGTGRS